jgi:endo-1,4-beta-mannosidase
VFITYEAWTADKEAFRKNLVHFVRAAHQRGMETMPTIGSMPREAFQGDAGLPLAREWVQDLVKTIGEEPGLAFWDATNEPDYPPTPAERMQRRMELAKDMAGFFHEFDKKTPVTIGFAFVPGMEELAGAVDVLSFHDYMQNRAVIHANIARAKAFAAKVGKPVFNTEIGCVARANL